MATRNQIDSPLAAATGTGSFVLATSPTITTPTFVTPIIGTPTSGNISGCTNLPWGTVNSRAVSCQYTAGTITADQIKNLVASPFPLIAAQGANTIIIVNRIYFYFTYIAPVYTAASSQSLLILYDDLSTQISANILPPASMTATHDSVTVQNFVVSAGSAAQINSGVQVSISPATDVTDGNGTLNYLLQYTVFLIA